RPSSRSDAANSVHYRLGLEPRSAAISQRVDEDRSDEQDHARFSGRGNGQREFGYEAAGDSNVEGAADDAQRSELRSRAGGRPGRRARTPQEMGSVIAAIRSSIATVSTS